VSAELGGVAQLMVERLATFDAEHWPDRVASDLGVGDREYGYNVLSTWTSAMRFCLEFVA
jgi:hypothetical protein